MRQDSAQFEQVIELACEAGAAIMAIYTAGADSMATSLKSDDSPLTAADLASHDIICRGLHRLFPAAHIVSEEDKTQQDRVGLPQEFWLIDPLDGTKEFIARNGEFTVNIALIRDGAPVWGVVYAPARDQLYWGGEAGAFRRSGGATTRIGVNASATAHAVCKVVASKSHLNQETDDFIARLGPVELVQAGSSLKFCLIAEGSADIYPRLAPTCEWDTAAAQAIVEAAGGIVVDTSGQRVVYGKANVLNPHFIASARPIASMVRE